MPGEETTLADGRIVRSESPLNLEIERIFQSRRSIAMRGGYT